MEQVLVQAAGPAKPNNRQEMDSEARPTPHWAQGLAPHTSQPSEQLSKEMWKPQHPHLYTGDMMLLCDFLEVIQLRG